MCAARARPWPAGAVGNLTDHGRAEVGPLPPHSRPQEGCVGGAPSCGPTPTLHPLRSQRAGPRLAGSTARLPAPCPQEQFVPLVTAGPTCALWGLPTPWLPTLSAELSVALLVASAGPSQDPRNIAVCVGTVEVECQGRVLEVLEEGNKLAWVPPAGLVSGSITDQAWGVWLHTSVHDLGQRQMLNQLSPQASPGKH